MTQSMLHIVPRCAHSFECCGLPRTAPVMPVIPAFTAKVLLILSSHSFLGRPDGMALLSAGYAYVVVGVEGCAAQQR